MAIYQFISSIILHVKYCRILNQIYRNENIIYNLSKLFGTQFRKDWIGRLYTVINPNIVDGKYNINERIFESDMTTDAYIEKWIISNMLAAEEFIKAHVLFELLSYELKRLDDYDNYLLILKPISLDDIVNYGKKSVILISIIAAICIVAYITWNLLK